MSDEHPLAPPPRAPTSAAAPSSTPATAAAPPGKRRMVCPPGEALLAFAKELGTEEERARTQEHVRDCRVCTAKLESFRSADVLPRRRPRRTLPYLTIGATAAIALLLGGVLYLGTRAARQRKAPRVPEYQHELPVTLLSPSAVDGVQRPVTLVWQRVPAAVWYDVEVVGAEAGWPVFAATTEDSSVTIPRGSKLRAGARYNWWVQARLPDGTHRRSSLRALRIGGR